MFSKVHYFPAKTFPANSVAISGLLFCTFLLILKPFSMDLISASILSALAGVIPFFPKIFCSVRKKVAVSRLWRYSAFIFTYCKRIDNRSLFSLLGMTASVLVLGRLLNMVSPICSKWIVDTLTNERRFCWELIAAEVFVKFLDRACLMALLRQIVTRKAKQTIFIDMQADLLTHVLRLPHSFLVDKSSGEISGRMMRGFNNMCRFVEDGIFLFLPHLLDVLIACVYFTFNSTWYMACAVVITVSVYLYATVIIVGKQNEYSRFRDEATEEADGMICDVLSNFETVKYFGNQQMEADRYKDAANKVMVHETKVDNSTTTEYVSQAFILSTSMLFGCLSMAYKLVTENLTVGDYVMFVQYLDNLYAPIEMMGYGVMNVSDSLTGMEGMFELFNSKPEAPLMVGSFEKVTGDIAFEDVSFSYDGSRDILKNVSFTVPHGQMVAIVGPTGSGKSTIVKLLHRLYHANAGRISIGGNDVEDIDLDHLRAAMAIVPQDCDLFNETLAYNIRYGRIDATDDEVVQAAKAAQIHNFINGLVEGYETKVGESGVKLSGGERQRIAIARAVLKTPEFMFMDEATSSLDSATESEVQAALNEVSRGKTSIFIAHRLSTIVNANKIIVLKNGVVVEQGNHSELLELDGLYAKMWRLQAQGKEVDDVSD